jgi:hypothetical protein
MADAATINGIPIENFSHINGIPIENFSNINGVLDIALGSPDWPSWNGSTDSSVAVLNAGWGGNQGIDAITFDTDKVLYIYKDVLSTTKMVVIDTSVSPPAWKIPIPLGVTADAGTLSFVSTGKVLFCYSKANDSTARARIINISGFVPIAATESNSFGNLESTGFPVGGVANSTTKGALLYVNDSFNLIANALTINGNDTITPAVSPLIIEADGVGSSSYTYTIRKLTSTTSVIFYGSSDALTTLSAVLTLNNDDTLTKGSVRTVNTSSSFIVPWGMATIQAGTYVSWAINSDDGKIKVTVITASGTTVDSGSSIDIQTQGSTYPDISITRAQDNIAFISYASNASPSHGVGIVATISGKVITPGSPHNFTTPQAAVFVGANVNDSKIMMTYGNQDASLRTEGILIKPPLA